MLKDLELSSKQMDLRGIPCPLNYVRVSLALEKLKREEKLYVFLDKGEPESMVIGSLKQAGHNVKIVSEDERSISILVICCDG